MLTILGIIAAISMVTLKPAEFRAKGMKVKAQKVMHNLDSATTEILLNDSILNGNDVIMQSCEVSDLLSYYKKYMATNNKTASTSDCDGSSRFFLKSGACIGLNEPIMVNAIFPSATGAYKITPTCAVLYFDVNGSKTPNEYGADRFIIPLNRTGLEYSTSGLDKCRNFSSDGKTCAECASGYGLTNNGYSCEKCTVAKCSSCKGNPNYCTYCIDGYGVSNGTCQKCSDSNCAYCNNNQNVCTACIGFYKLENGNCIPQTSGTQITNCYLYNSDFTSCTWCNVGYGYTSDHSSCVKCTDSNCSFCNGAGASVCTYCNNGYRLENGSCVENN